MKGFKFEPVKWLSWVAFAVIALAGSQEFVDVVPAKVAGGLLLAAAVATRLLGGVARSKTTALAAPEDADGNALVAKQ